MQPEQFPIFQVNNIELWVDYSYPNINQSIRGVFIFCKYIIKDQVQK